MKRDEKVERMTIEELKASCQGHGYEQQRRWACVFCAEILKKQGEKEEA